jgi:hypothetical protein
VTTGECRSAARRPAAAEMEYLTDNPGAAHRRMAALVDAS